MEKIKKRHSGFIDRTGEVHKNTNGESFTIVGCRGKKGIDIQFEDGVIIKNREYKDIVKGNVKNPYHKVICGIGYIGVGKYGGKNHRKIYHTWVNMLKRCYNEKRPTYKSCSVDERWHNFQVFAEWFEKNHKEEFQLDKDILQKGNKTYSPETCCFVPQEINLQFTKRDASRGNCPIGVSKAENKFKACIRINGKTVGLGTYDTPEEAFEVYKVAKEIHIKEVADKWRPFIELKVYIAMYNYKVEITD